LQQAAQDGLRVVRLPGDRPRFLLVAPADRLAALEPQTLPDGSLDWRRADIEAGVPRVGPSTQDRWVAQMVNLDQLGGVAFDKGCYTGQEVVARLHYLGNLKKRLFRIQGSGPTPLPGDDILDADGDAQAVGEIVDAVETEGGFVASAVLQLAKAESSALRTGAATLAPPSPYRYPA
jgi:folate-binding protein YgfZ